jgi:hypothetical protein
MVRPCMQPSKDHANSFHFFGSRQLLASVFRASEQMKRCDVPRALRRPAPSGHSRSSGRNSSFNFTAVLLDHDLAHASVFLVGAVAPVNRVRLAQGGLFFHPLQ